MDFAQFLRAVFALAITLGLVGLAAVALRRFGPDAIGRLLPTRKERRLAVIESLALDPTRRLVLVNCDGKERLLLLGEGRLLPDDPPPAPSAPHRRPAKAPE